MAAGPASEARQQQGGADVHLSGEELVVLREALHVIRQVGDRVWPGWTDGPLPVLVIDDEYEHLLNPPDRWQPPPDFQQTEQRFADQPVYRRDRVLPPTLRASFPIAGLPTAVVGAWRGSEETPNEWVITLTHEWFHVLQLRRGEQQKVERLQLGALDNPSWQLDYPFPYADPDVGHAMQLFGQALYDVWLNSRHLPQEGQRTFVAETAWAALQNLQAILNLKHSEGAHRYFQFQTWKEGVARYTAVQVAREVASLELNDQYQHVPGFTLLQGATTYTRLWEDVIRNNYWLIRNAGRPGERDRTSFYGLGHGMAELLDLLAPSWKDRYFDLDVWLDDLMADTMQAHEAAQEPHR